MKFSKESLKPILTNVAVATAGMVAAGYAKPEIENALGNTAGQYSDEIITVAGTLVAAYGGKNPKNGKMIRNFGIGFAVRGLMGVLDKYVFKSQTQPETAARGINAPMTVPALAPVNFDEPVEVINLSEEKVQEPIQISIV